MSKRKTFPRLLHVTIDYTDKDDPFLLACESGVFDVSEAETPMALYKLISVGKVHITKRYEGKEVSS